MKKKAQITLFVIIAIVIIGLIAIFFIFSSNTKKSLSLPPEAKLISSEINFCIENLTREAIIKAEAGGGIIYPSNRGSDFFRTSIPYYNLAKVSEETIEKEIAIYLDKNINNCTKNIKSSYGFVFGTSKTYVALNESILVRMKLPITLTKEEKSIKIDEFSVKINSNLSRLYGVANLIKESKVLNESSLCVSCVTKIADEEGVYVGLLDFKEEGIVFFVMSKGDELNRETNQTEAFVFALK